MSTLGLEKDIAYLRGTIEQFDKRLTRVESELSEFRREFKEELHKLRDELKAEINQLRTELKAEINQLRSEMLTMFRWAIGIVLGTWISVIVPLLLKVLGLI